MVFLGVTLGMLIDIYRVVITLIRPGKYLAAAYDLVFWFAAALWVFLYMLGVTTGEARFYMLVLLVGGYFLEQWLLGKALRVSMRSTILAVARLVNWIIGNLAALLNAVLDFCVAPYRWLYRLILGPIKFMLYWVQRPFVVALTKVDRVKRTIAKWWRGQEPTDI